MAIVSKENVAFENMVLSMMEKIIELQNDIMDEMVELRKLANLGERAYNQLKPIG